MAKTITIEDFLTERQISEAIEIYRTAKQGQVAKLITRRIIAPNIDTINIKLGQENDPAYLGYLVEHVLNMCGFKAAHKIAS